MDGNSPSSLFNKDPDDSEGECDGTTNGPKRDWINSTLVPRLDRRDRRDGLQLIILKMGKN